MFLQKKTPPVYILGCSWDTRIVSAFKPGTHGGRGAVESACELAAHVCDLL